MRECKRASRKVGYHSTYYNNGFFAGVLDLFIHNTNNTDVFVVLKQLSALYTCFSYIWRQWDFLLLYSQFINWCRERACL